MTEQIFFIIMSIISFGIILFPLSVMVDKTRNNEKDWSIFLFVAQFGIFMYFGLFFFIRSL